jgi:N-methylhydantoinase A
MSFAISRPKSSCRNGRKPPSRAYFPEAGGFVATPVYDREALEPAMTFDGPAIVEERESTLIVGARGTGRVDENLNVIVEFSSEK